MFNPNREQVRQFFIDTWKKKESNNLSEMEQIALKWMVEHPEFFKYYDEKYLDQDFSVEMGQTNPFLHLAMHLTIEEQLRANQPPGIQNSFLKLQAKLSCPHKAMHEIFECLAEQIYQNQKNNAEFSSTGYLSCIEKKAANK